MYISKPTSDNGTLTDHIYLNQANHREYQFQAFQTIRMGNNRPFFKNICYPNASLVYFKYRFAKIQFQWGYLSYEQYVHTCLILRSSWCTNKRNCLSTRPNTMMVNEVPRNKCPAFDAFEHDIQQFTARGQPQ